MSIRWHRDKIRADLDGLGLLVDLLMIALVIINLSLILFDWLFSAAPVRELLGLLLPTFTAFYADTIHSDFIFWDLLFVSVYLTEFSIRWIIAIARQTHARWFYYPFIHWYDLLGCIPVGGFRWLRILRVISLLYRLQRTGIVDLRETWLGKTLLRYYGILVEEISDRVVINVLEGAQNEISQGSPLTHRIESQVLAPRRPELVDFAARRLIDISSRTHQRWRAPLGDYLTTLTDAALARTSSGARLAAIPVAGPRALALIGDTVRELGLALSDQLVADLQNDAHRGQLDALLDDLIRHAAGDREQLDRLLRETLLGILEQVKAEVAVQRWRQSAGQ